MHENRSGDGKFSQRAAAASDRDLLARFVRRSDERAFAEIVRRHGSLVLGVCRRVLRDRHAAEDAFQATFLVLARSARTIRRQRSLASWLHSVAYRIARRSLAESHRRREQAVPMETVPTDDELLDVGALYEQQLLDEELQELPDKYREPLVLHHLQGLTQQQVAERLGMSVAAVDGRLKRGRKRLKLRLLRRGVEFGTVLAAVTLGQSAVQAASIEPLIALTTQAAAAAHAGSPALSPVSPQAARLAGKELTLMSGSSKLVATLAISAVVVTLIGLVAGNAASVEGATDRDNLPLISTAESFLTAPMADARLAQADRDDVVASTNETADSTNLQEEIDHLSRDVADLADSVRANAAEVNNPKQELQNAIDGLQKAIDGLNRELTTLQEQPAASAGESGEGANAGERSESRLPVRQPTLEYTRPTPAAERIEAALNSETSIEFSATPLRDVIEYISLVHDIPVLLEEQTLLNAGISPDEEISLVISGISLHSALEILLENVAGVKLDYVIQNEVLTITTREQADRILDTRVYNLRNLSSAYSPEEVARLIRSTIRPWTWRVEQGFWESPGVSFGADVYVDERFQASVEALSDAIAVTQSQRIHREVVDLLQQLHRHDSESITSGIITAAVNEQLDQLVELEFRDNPLREALQFLADKYGINFVLDEVALQNAGLSGSEEISIFLSGVTLRSALKIVLSQVGLTFLVEDEVIKITTPEVAAAHRDAATTGHEASSSDIADAYDPVFPEDVSITGVIRVRGTVPALPPLVVAGDPRFKDSSILEADLPDESLIAGDDNGLVNVFVWLRNVPEGVSIPTGPSEPLALASSGLRYVPHAAIARTGQPLGLTNADPVACNVHMLPLLNASFNQLIAARDLEGVRFEFDRPERQPVRMVDDFHPARVGYILPLDHPFADLTDDSGRFNIRQLPPGEYELTIWHERAGYLERNLSVTVPETGAAEVNLEIDVEQLFDR